MASTAPYLAGIFERKRLKFLIHYEMNFFILRAKEDGFHALAAANFR
jgi:hypothetical protein